MKQNYAIIGLGFISDRHIQAIEDTGGKILLSCDIDKEKKHKVPEAKFFEKWKDMMRDPLFKKIDCVAICTPNNLHSIMTATCASFGKKVICEKPLVIDYKDFKTLKKYSHLIYSVVQLRNNPELQRIQESITDTASYHAEFNVSVHRGDWYFDTWKGDDDKSGGLLFNIGVHYFDLLTWFFGEPIQIMNDLVTDKVARGKIGFKNCSAKWNLSIEQPKDNQYRYFKLNKEAINLTKYFDSLHKKVYENMLNGIGVRLNEIEPTIKLIEKLYGK